MTTFGKSKVPRFVDRADAIPGPGAYELKDGKRVEGKNSYLSGTTKRWGDGPDETDRKRGPGLYTPSKPAEVISPNSKRKRMSSVFAPGTASAGAAAGGLAMTGHRLSFSAHKRSRTSMY